MMEMLLAKAAANARLCSRRHWRSYHCSASARGRRSEPGGREKG